LAPDFAGGAHGVEDASDQLFRTCTFGVVEFPAGQQFGVCQHDAQLIIEPVKEEPEVGLDLPVFTFTDLHEGRETHAPGPAGIAGPDDIDRDDSLGSRHSESTKMRIEPPAVRTYSTFPLEIQL
jgi:hypothetical protein